MALSIAVVLVVEDSPLILMSALDLVTTAGFEGIGAASADEAIAILEARADVRLVFTDVEMPGTIDGVKLAHYIRNRWPNTFDRCLRQSDPGRESTSHWLELFFQAL